MNDSTSPAIRAVAVRLDDAVRAATTTDRPSQTTPLTLTEAYAVQRAGVALRAARGDVQAGVKLGFTSRAKAEQMGVADVIAGVITRSMQVADGGTLDVDRLIHARVEPEVAFRLGSDLDPHAGGDPLDAVAEIAPALEVIDSRYQAFRFSLEDVVADNTSASRFVVGPWTPFDDARARLDLADLDVSLEIDGAVAAAGSTAAILGDPLEAMAAIRRMAAEHGLVMPAGTIVLAGAATEAVPLPTTPGAAVSATVVGLGTVSLSIAAGGGS
ncbi:MULTISPECIES: 2-keto-4-pentenoate hydratase [unclassified Nocardioides]|uniref:2-keto-4-pentenoate hydratase n=1 Tax=unclassified Nocardioides TaxID=2615069 RepID=UPI00361B1E6A